MQEKHERRGRKETKFRTQHTKDQSKCELPYSVIASRFFFSLHADTYRMKETK